MLRRYASRFSVARRGRIALLEPLHQEATEDRAEPSGVAGGDGSADHGGGKSRTADARPRRRPAGIEPTRRAGI
jgi:hypothetical protein